MRLDLDLLRGKLEDAIAQVFAEVQRLRAERAAAEEAYHICEQHRPEAWEGDGTCVICEGQRLAAEVERLKADLARISEELGLPPTIGPAPGEVKRRETLLRDSLAEVERLKADQSDWRKGVALIASALGETAPKDLCCVRLSERTLTVRAEVERLTATLSASEAQAVERQREAAEWAAGWWRSLGKSHGGNVKNSWREAVEARFHLPVAEETK